jgi:hypothetical protein
MRFPRHPLPSILTTLAVVLYGAMHIQSLPAPSAVLARVEGSGAPDYVYADVPFVVHDRYATQICISSRSGRPLPPFVSPALRFGAGGVSPAPDSVHAWIPFVVRDGHSTQICVSTRGGQPLLPFIDP